MKPKVISFKAPPELLARLKAECTKRGGRSQSSVIREAVETYLNKKP